MRAYLDDEPLELEGETLTAAVVAGKRAADARGRMIIEVWADGEPAPSADLESPPDAEPYAGEVRFVSVEPAGLVAAAMDEAAENLERVREPQREAAAALSRGETSSGMQDVGVCLQAWESVRKAVQDGCSVLGRSPAELMPTAASAEACATAIEDLLTTLREVQRSVKEQDVASLADAMAYDLDELAETWAGLLGEMSAGVRTVKAGE